MATLRAMSAPHPDPALLEAAHAAADAAARITLAGFRGSLVVEDKSAGDADYDPVTRVDRDAESAIREVLRARCPDIGFVGEESSAGPAPAVGDGPRWVVDPIDGTRAYVAGIPVWGTLIALAGTGQDDFGLLDQPFLGERFVGHALGTTLRSRDAVRPLRTRRGRALDAAVLCATAPEMFAPGEQADAFARVARDAMTVRWGTDCYGYAMLAAGHVDAVVEAGLAPWDIEALIPVVRGAGGTISDWRGGPPSGSSCIAAAGSASLHAELLLRLAADSGHDSGRGSSASVPSAPVSGASDGRR